MIVLISGTNRPESNTRRITRLLETEYAALGVPHRVLDLVELPVDLFLPETYATKPVAFQPFADAIVSATGLHVVTPEYNGGVPGVLKYFIDHLKFPESFDRKPVCFTGLAAGMWGALRPVEQLQSIFSYRNAYLYPERVFIPGVGTALTETGQLRDADLAKRLRQQAQGFATFVNSIGSITAR